MVLLWWRKWPCCVHWLQLLEELMARVLDQASGNLVSANPRSHLVLVSCGWCSQLPQKEWLKKNKKHTCITLQFQGSEIKHPSYWAKANILQGWFLLEAPGENPSPGLSHLLEAALACGRFLQLHIPLTGTSASVVTSPLWSLLRGPSWLHWVRLDTPG